MNENIKKFVEKINQSESLKKEFNELNEKLKGETNRETAVKAHILPFAKKAGFDFTLEDFETEGELAEEELKAVAGGTDCGCFCLGAGGGGGTDADDGKTYGCACVLYGQGGDGSYDDFNCSCVGGGDGYDQER